MQFLEHGAEPVDVGLVLVNGEADAQHVAAAVGDDIGRHQAVVDRGC